MYKILLADDEGIVLESLHFIIEKNFKGLCEVETAKTGRRVIEIAENFHPDIAFMDIQMVGINGIEAMKEIRKKNSNMILIVLTAYDIFDYAKESVHLGVLEYLNKPIQQKEIVAVLKKAMGLVDEKKEKRIAELKGLEKMQSLMPMMENGLIDGLLFHEYQEEEIAQFKEILGVSCQYGYFAVLQFDRWNTELDKGKIACCLKKEQGLLRDQIKNSISCLMGAPIQNKIPVYLPARHQRTNQEKEAAVYAIWNSLQQKLERQNPVGLRIGIGECCPLEMACCSYYQAREALERTAQSVSCSWKLQRNVEEDEFITTMEEQIWNALKEGDNIYCREMSTLLLQFFERENETEGKPDGSIEVLKQELIGKLEIICNNMRMQKEERAKSVVMRGKEYIEQHFQEDISLAELADNLSISPHYFSRLFKEEAGMNYIDYLTSIRIQYAKKMLVESNENIQKVCSLAGYADPNYFSRIFKKYVGITPSDFREGGNVIV